MLNLVLHAHLPYVNHPEQPGTIEESWLFEAILECYIPLIQMFDRLQTDHVHVRLTVSLSPPLITMLKSPTLIDRFENRFQQLTALCEYEVQRTHHHPDFYASARMYQKKLADSHKTFKKWEQDIVSAFVHYQETGMLELITTTATHGFLPLLSHQPCAVKAQLATGLDMFYATTKHTTSGLWLPECGYFYGLSELLKRYNVAYTFTDSHAFIDALPEKNDRDIYTPIQFNNVAFFARDPESSEQVWSRETGYPAHPLYREYYRDIGMELEEQAITPFLFDGKQRTATGIKYYAISASDQDKQPYHYNAAVSQAKRHAEDFITLKKYQLQRIEDITTPIITAPFDAELFGHWWYEGPIWLEHVIRLCANDQSAPQLATAGDYLDSVSASYYDIAEPAASSWGKGGYNQFWLSQSNQWIHPLLNDACNRMQQLTHNHSNNEPGNLVDRAMKQAARSLLLAQASDWPFIINSGTTASYAEQRFNDHLARFNYLDESIRSDHIEPDYLHALEVMDEIFPDVDYGLYKP